jgi:monoamine oxidase
VSRSLYTALFNLYNPHLQADLMEFSAAARRRTHASHLFPEDLAPDALANCTQLPQVRVAVIGAGFAGLAAGWYLRQCGLTPTVYEASARINGRVETDVTLVSGKTIEAGAELIGANHPMWIELANRFGLTLVPVTTEDEYERSGLRVRIRFADHDLTEPERQQLLTDLLPVIDAIGLDAKDIDPSQPWLSPNAAALDAMSVSDKLDQVLGPQSSLVRTAIEFIVGNDNCATPNLQSYLGLLCLVSAGRTGDDTEGLRGYWEFTETHRCELGNERLENSLGSQLTDAWT